MAVDSLQQERLKKLEDLKKEGINPYPAKTGIRQQISQARNQINERAAVAGRIRSIRPHGKITFMDVEDLSGKIQLLFSQIDLTKEKYQILSDLDVGDFIWGEGEVFKTQAGEITIKISDFQLLTKSLLPMPTEYFGLKDIETRLRKRYLDLAVNPETKEMFFKKARFWNSIREFLLENGFVEVMTPALEAIPGGAEARPFITHHHALNRDFYLRISLELYQKRLLVGGFEKIFEIGRVFRNEGIDADHLQDYTQMEFYWAYASCDNLISFSQELFQQIILKTMGSLKTKYQGEEIDWSGDWPRLDYGEAFFKETGIDLDKEVSLKKLYDFAEKHKISTEEEMGIGRLIDSIYKKVVRPKIIQPTFLINHPVSVSPLAKRKEDNPQRTERMQIVAGGSELCNAYSELNDPLDQLKRFEEQQSLRERGDEEAQMLDYDFIEALKYGMPPAAGFGMSERLFSFLMDKPIREVVFFPVMKEER